jgi:hypothetical protein
VTKAGLAGQPVVACSTPAFCWAQQHQWHVAQLIPSVFSSLPCTSSPQVNRKNVHGQTPLMLACKAGAADCVRLLLEAGADATLFDSLQQRTALHYAGEY